MISSARATEIRAAAAAENQLAAGGSPRLGLGQQQRDNRVLEPIREAAQPARPFRLALPEASKPGSWCPHDQQTPQLGAKWQRWDPDLCAS